ncbi:unnamed protein product [Echinostoma caproni]|uniref:Uncharacterized protein n=1 Tax=Echinostoma caproni TaxID=27848 RepID=A0A3P8HXN8_9TREM|nr:unnamed protein product [Echinostoma caproni]
MKPTKKQRPRKASKLKPVLLPTHLRVDGDNGEHDDDGGDGIDSGGEGVQMRRTVVTGVLDKEEDDAEVDANELRTKSEAESR